MGFDYVLKNANGEYLSDIKALGDRFEKNFTKDLSKAKVYSSVSSRNYMEDVGMLDGEIFVRKRDEEKLKEV